MVTERLAYAFGIAMLCQIANGGSNDFERHLFGRWDCKSPKSGFKWIDIATNNVIVSCYEWLDARHKLIETNRYAITTFFGYDHSMFVAFLGSTQQIEASSCPMLFRQMEIERVETATNLQFVLRARSPWEDHHWVNFVRVSTVTNGLSGR